MAVRNLLFDVGLLPSREFDIPIICVGNLNTGGTGKTPHTEYLIRTLKQRGFHPAVLSRGYKRYTKGFAEARKEPSSRRVGDEPAQIKSKFPDIVVAVCNQRVRGIRKLMEQHEDLDCILLDDAFQHRWVDAGLSILLTRHGDLYEHDHLLPSGNLRESSSGAKRADIIIVTKTPRDLSPLDRRVILYDLSPLAHQEVFFSFIELGNLQPVFPDQTTSPDPEIGPGMTVVTMTGIADPDPFYECLEEKNCTVHSFRFQDHHEFTSSNIQQVVQAYEDAEGPNKIILLTEKDAVRLRSNSNRDKLLGLPVYYLPMKIRFLDNPQEFDRKILRYVEQDQKYDRIYPQ